MLMTSYGVLTREQAHKRKIAGYILLYLERHSSASVNDLQYGVTGIIPRSANEVFTRGHAKWLHKQVGGVIPLLEGKRHIVRKGNRLFPTDEGLKALKAWKAVEQFRKNQCAYHEYMMTILDWLEMHPLSKESMEEAFDMYRQPLRPMFRNALEILTNAEIVITHEDGYYDLSWVLNDVYKYMMPEGSFDEHVMITDDYSEKKN